MDQSSFMLYRMEIIHLLPKITAHKNNPRVCCHSHSVVRGLGGEQHHSLLLQGKGFWCSRIRGQADHKPKETKGLCQTPTPCVSEDLALSFHFPYWKWWEDVLLKLPNKSTVILRPFWHFHMSSVVFQLQTLIKALPVPRCLPWSLRAPATTGAQSCFNQSMLSLMNILTHLFDRN